MADNNNTKILNVPNLRFPEFSREWENKTIDELFELRNGYTPSKANHDFWEGGTIPWFRMEDIRQNGGILSDAIQHITPKAIKGSGLFERYSIILATTATIGEHAMLIADSLANQRFTNFKVRKSLTNSYNPYYLYYYFFKIDRWCLRNVNAGGLLSVDIPSLKRERLFAPCLKEQNKIAQLMRHIDERIATQNKIIEKLETLIKGLAVALTTKEKANIAISQCLECHSSTLQESEVLSSGLCKVFGANGLVGYKDVPQMNGDAILVIKDGSGVGTVSYAQGKFSVIGTLNYLTVIGNNDLRYLYFALSVFNFQPYKTGMAIPHIYFKDYGKAKIYCPSLAEQKRVANVLDKLESKLFVEQELLASFNQQKLYLLGKMFI